MNKEECRYRGPDNTSCAVGCLIPDADYNPKFEGKAIAPYMFSEVISENTKYGATVYMKERGYNLDLLKRLQGIHDHPNETQIKERWPVLLNELERTFMTLREATAE